MSFLLPKKNRNCRGSDSQAAICRNRAVAANFPDREERQRTDLTEAAVHKNRKVFPVGTLATATSIRTE